MKTYDLKDPHRGRASFWHNVREVLRRAAPPEPAHHPLAPRARAQLVTV